MEFDLSPFLIQYGSFGIRYYSLMYLLGVGICYWWLTRKGGYDRDKISDLVLTGFFMVVLGGRLGYVLFYHPEWLISDPLQALKIWEGGMSYHGGVTAVVLYVLWQVKKNAWELWKFADHLVIPVILATGFGRIGNFLNGELWGRMTEVPWCFYVDGWEGCRHPSQLYQAGLNILTFFFLAWHVKRSKKPGTTAALYLVLYGLGRSLVEQLWREPSWVWMGITAGTWLSIPMVIIGLILYGQRKMEA